MKNNIVIKNRLDIITTGDVSTGRKVSIHNGHTLTSFIPSTEMVGLKYGEFVKTRTVAKKRLKPTKVIVKPTSKSKPVAGKKK